MNLVRNFKTRLLVAFLAIVAIVPAAFAQDPPTVDWAAQATTVKNTLTSQVVAVLPILLVLMALFVGIAVFRRMIKGFSK